MIHFILSITGIYHSKDTELLKLFQGLQNQDEIL